MKIAIFGAGAIGCFVAGMLARDGHDPLLIARGETLKAVNKKGLTVTLDGDGSFTVPVRATDDAVSAGPQDMVILATKAQQIAGALDGLAPLLGPETAVAPLINGIPWWYCKGLSGHPLADRDLASCDPSGRIGKLIGVERVIGGVVYLASSIPEPGQVLSVGPRTIILGEASGAQTGRLGTLTDALSGSGFDVEATADIRTAAWIKLWGNVHANPMSVIVEGTMEDMLGDPLVADVSRRIMEETREVAAGFGISFPMTIETRLKEGRALGQFRTSMLQDFDRGRAIELDAILGVVAELGHEMGIATPTIDMLYALTRRKAAIAGCYSPPE